MMSLDYYQTAWDNTSQKLYRSLECEYQDMSQWCHSTEIAMDSYYEKYLVYCELQDDRFILSIFS
jgi:hypothetical protein